tara:strand:- start:93 stop:317 length:225 start_codon:yes stop_codon:yes gene_type:complete
MEYKKYHEEGIKQLNKEKEWINCKINIKLDPNKNTEYILYATGDCDMNGRKYVALPSNIDHKNVNIIKKYNLFN